MSYKPTASDFKTEVVSGVSPSGETFNRMIITFYTREMWRDIHFEVEQSIREELKKHIAQDREFRTKIAEEIRAAAAVLPLEAITDAVKAAVASLKSEEVA